MTADPRLRSVPCLDLLHLTAGEKLWELTLPLPWLAFSLGCYAQGQWLWGALGSFYLFLTGLRQSHGAQHYTLGISRLSQDLVLAALSVLMLASMHAVQVSHLHRHRHCLDEDDAEGSTAKRRWIAAEVLFPAVPTGHLWRLAERLDAALSGVTWKQVVGPDLALDPPEAA